MSDEHVVNLTFFSESDVARMLGMSRDWLAREARAGKVPSVNFGNRRRYTPENIAKIVDLYTTKVEEKPIPVRRRRGGTGNLREVSNP